MSNREKNKIHFILTKLQTEARDLCARGIKLTAFMQTHDFWCMDSRERRAMLDQALAMSDYLTALKYRIKLIKGRL